jgi:aldehyde:ferredoxin oxidoreductase
VGFERVAELVRAVTGWNTSVFELMKVGERALNMAQAFNRREGFSPADDVLPRRFFTPHPSGPLKGVSREEKAFSEAKESYYRMMGWPEGRPSGAKLEELGVDWIVPLMEGK